MAYIDKFRNRNRFVFSNDDELYEDILRRKRITSLRQYETPLFPSLQSKPSIKTFPPAKYGALSQQGGRVSINWRSEGEELVVVDWVERGGPEVAAERTPGFGTDLIQKIVAHELRQPVAIRFDPEGVSCTLRVPLRVRREFQIRERLARLSD